MEFIKKTGEKFVIDSICSSIIYKENTIRVTYVNFFELTKGIFYTDDYIIKYDNKMLFVSTKGTWDIIDYYNFSKFTGESISNNTDTLINCFEVKKGMTLKLYRTVDGSKLYINIINENEDKTTDSVIETSGLGNDTVYKTFNGNTLLISSSSTRNSKWNKLPIGKLN